MMAGEWADPDRGKVKLAGYGATWIAERPGLRVPTLRSKPSRAGETMTTAPRCVGPSAPMAR
jgi:hypothetical protein